MADVQELRRKDLVPVFSRVSWGALFAGLFVTLSVFFLLSALGAAIGLSIADTTRGENIATGAAIWAVAAALIAYFCGGCVTSMLTAGESRAEAAVYGTILWGLTFATLMMMTGSVIRTGFTTVVGTANVAANATNPPQNWEQAARQAGLTDAQVQQMRAQMPTTQQVQDTSASAAWWSLLGLCLSLAASIGGAIAGAGSRSFMEGGVFHRRTTVAIGHG